MKKYILSCLCLLWCYMAYAQTPIVYPPLSEKTWIAPAFFGPNAFAVPEMTDGSVSRELRVDIYGTGDFGYAGDKTATIGGKLTFPLFTDRANLVIWMPIWEWWHNSDQRMTESRLTDESARSGGGAGDVYISTDILVLREKQKVPGITIRAALRTASGGNYDKARYYDSPGYFFDIGIGKTFALAEDWSIRTAISGGFLCWQTDNGRQNDAVMYAARVKLSWKYMFLTADYAGYWGWERKGDQPMVLRAKLGGDIKGFEPYLSYQWGIIDFPWHTVQIGLAWKWDVLSIRSAAKSAK